MMVNINSKAREQTKRSSTRNFFFKSRVGKRTGQSLITSTPETQQAS